MTLRQLEILRALVRHRTTVAAAEELALSQPAISNALKVMEAQAGFALFHRINNRLFPTAEALSLQAESEAIFALHAKLDARVRDLRDNRSGQLSIMSTPPLGYSLVPPALRDFLRERPQTRVHFDVRRYEGVTEGVISGVAELGFVLGTSHQPGLVFEPIHAAEMVCVLPTDHPLTARARIGAADLAGERLIGLERGTRLGEAVRAAFDAAAVDYVPSVEVRYCNSACALVAAGVGVAVVDPFSPTQGAAHPLAVRPFTPAAPAVAYMLWSEAQPLSRLAHSFREQMREAGRLLAA